MENELSQEHRESFTELLQNRVDDLQEEVGVLKNRLEGFQKIRSSTSQGSSNDITYLNEEFSNIFDPEAKASFLEDRLLQSERKKSLLESNLETLAEDLHKAEEERDKWRNQYESSLIFNTGPVPGASMVHSGTKVGLADIIHENHLLKRQMDSIYKEIKSQENYAFSDHIDLPQSDEEVSWKNKYHNLYSAIDEQMKLYGAISTARSNQVASDKYLPGVLSNKSNVSSINENHVKDLHVQVRNLSKENESLKQEISELSILAESSNREDENQESLAKLAKLREDKENWARRYELLQLDFVSASDSYEREVTRLTNELQELETKTNHHSKEIDRLNGLLSVFEKEDDAMTQQLKQSSQDSLNLREENSLLKDKIKMLMEQIQKQEETISTLRDVAENDRKNMMEKVKKTESQMLHMNEEHEFQTAALRTETEEKHKMTMELQCDLEKLTDRVSDLTAQLDAFKEANCQKAEQIAVLHRDNRCLIGKLQGLNEEFKKQSDHWKDAMRGSFDTNDELRNEINAWREKYENKELELIEFRASHDVDIEQLMALSRASQLRIYESEKELETLKSQLEDIQGEDEERRCRLHSLVLENTALKNSSDELKRELDDYKLKIQYSMQYFPRGTACNIL